MGRVREGYTTAPTETDNSVLFLRGWQRHSVLTNGVKLFLNPGRIERSDGSRSQWCDNTVRTFGKVFHRQKVWRDGNETISSELVSNAADPGRKSEDLVNDDHHRSLGTTLGIDNPDADAISATCVHDGILTMPGRGAQSGERTNGVSREARIIRHGDHRGGWRRRRMISM
jgi:hypothetical protein